LGPIAETIFVAFKALFQIKHVAAGFQPAFKFKQKFVLVVERGLEARGYLLIWERDLNATKTVWATAREARDSTFDIW